ncbi:MAG: transketolase [Demequinaceae bacterium]|nr:transketolase [Demequinaceae bacterium]
MAVNWIDADHRAIDTLRVLAADAVEKVGNGHPGTAISLTPAAYLLFQDVLRHDPADPHWLGRDRFVLSAGHSSLTLYLQLFASGYGLELKDLEELRTWGSLTPGHPEYGLTPGVEITTGPLGSGLAAAVGMAMASRRERGLLDPEAKPGESPFDHHIYVIASDGDLQEGVTAEASSLAGLQELGNLIVIWDDNRISIEGDTRVAFSEDVLARYEAYGWDIQRVDWVQPDGTYVEDLDALAGALAKAKADTHRPSIIALRTIIGWPCPTKQNTGGIHGSKLGADEVRALKEVLGFDPEASFAIDDDVLAHVRAVGDRGREAHATWNKAFASWEKQYPERAALLSRLAERRLPEGWEAALPTFEVGTRIATRAASGVVLNAIGPVLPELWGGSADLAGSTNTTMKEEPSFLPESVDVAGVTADPYGRTFHFGIREHAMGSIVNGVALHGLTRAYGATFLVFSDYMRPPVRLAAIMGIPSTFVWTHDSIGVGEDGPTHQPIEHLASLRAIPDFSVVRPADANETAWAWRGILERARPAGLILTRQDVPVLDQPAGTGIEGVLRGGYILAGTDDPQVIIVATGSEVQLAIGARDELAREGIAARVVSMPCREWFAEQDDAYRESVLPKAVRARVTVEAGIAQGWYDILGDAGRAVSLEHFGASADGAMLFDRYGFTVSAIVAAAKDSLEEAS